MSEKYDVTEIAKQAGSFRVFLQALEATGLKGTLQQTGPYTVLAPVDDAFLKMPKAKLENLFKTENRASLQSILKNHIIIGKLLSSDLRSYDETKSMKGEDLRIESRGGLWVNEAQVVTPDLEASNGVLHGIDAVITPQTQVATAQ